MDASNLTVKMTIETSGARSSPPWLHLRLLSRNTLAVCRRLASHSLEGLSPGDTARGDLEWVLEDLIRQDAAQDALGNPLLGRVLADNLVRD